MTKKIFIAFIALVMLPACIVAQDTLQKPLRFGYFSYEQVMKSIDYYAIAHIYNTFTFVYGYPYKTNINSTT